MLGLVLLGYKKNQRFWVQYNCYNTANLFYGLLFMIPVLFINLDSVDFSRFTQVQNVGNFFFLGIGASALCFVTWNFSVKNLGAVRSTVYIYTIPMLTTLASVFILGEMLTMKAFIGILLTLAGLILSEMPNFLYKRKIHTD